MNGRIKDMQVVVLMGGLGTRLQGITEGKPKSMIEVRGLPFFQYQMNILKWNGFSHFIFCVGYGGSTIENYFSDGMKSGMNIRYSYDGERLLGTGGALRQAYAMLEEDFIVIYGDSFMDVDYQEITYRYFREKETQGALGLMTILQNHDRYDKSNVVMQDHHQVYYNKIDRTSDMKFVDYGILVLNKRLIGRIPPQETCDIARILTDISAEGFLCGHEVKRRFYEIGSPASLAEFQEYVDLRFYTSHPAVFLDRDGTMTEIVFNEDSETLDAPLGCSELKLLPGVVEAVRAFRELGFLIFVVTNQPAAAKGKTTLEVIYDINRYFCDLLEKGHAALDEVFICPHFPKASERTRESFLIQDCRCRKPNPGLIQKAIGKYNIDIGKSFMVGDSHTDILAGFRAGLKTVFIGKYKCDLCQLLGEGKPDYIFNSLFELAEFLSRNKLEVGSDAKSPEP